MSARCLHRHWQALICLLISLFCAPAYAAVPGTLIENTAQAGFNVASTTGLTANSNTVAVTTTVTRTPATLSLLRYEPGAPLINEDAPTQCRSGTGGAFIPAADPTAPVINSGLITLDPTTALPLNAATTYHSTEPVFVQLQDTDQNLDPTSVETAIVEVSSSLGDVEDILLSETDVDSGVFIAYIQSAEGTAAAQYDCALAVAPDANIQVRYTDPADAGDSAFNETLVDPFGIVFNSISGDPVDGISVQLINATTGLPAEPGVDVFGNDGISSYPNTLVSGGTATDGGGTLYNFPAGGYRFPLVRPGNYRLEIINTPNYIAPSTVSIAELQSLPNAPFALPADASFGLNFALPPGPALHVDIPIDPVITELVVTKSSLSRNVGIGDFVRYQVAVENTEAAATIFGARIIDTLPTGFRYQPGSVRGLDGDGLPINDPLISSDGKTLEFTVADLSARQIVGLTYVTEVTAGTPLGDAINRARAESVFGSTSNIAQVAINVEDELMRERNTIIGRVIAGNCPLEKTQEGQTGLQLTSSQQGRQILYDIKFDASNVQLKEYQIAVKLPDGLHYVPASSMLDEYPLNNPEFNNQSLIYHFDPEQFQDTGSWEHRLQLRVEIDPASYGRKVTRAQARLVTEQNLTFNTPVASNLLLRQKPLYEERRFVFRPNFPTMESSLTSEDRQQLDRIIEVMRDIDVVKVGIEGHADIRPINTGSQYTDNLDLSRARARAVAPYFQAALNLGDDQITVGAAGDEEPVASNESASGLALNRRADIAVTALVRSNGKADQLVVNDSGKLKRVISPQALRGNVAVGTELEGVAGVRIYLEDGTYVVTDDYGKYHIEGVRPGTHVVQLDTASLPVGMRIVECEKNTRFAGSSYSKFIDLKPGTLWRIDFHVEEEPPEVSSASIQMHTQSVNNRLAYTIENKGGTLAISNYRLTVILPEGVQYQPGSSQIQRESIDDPQVNNNILIYRLGDLPANWDIPISFKANVSPKLEGQLTSKATAIFNSATMKNQHLAPVETNVQVEKRKVTVRRFVFKPKFETLGTELHIDDKRNLDALLPTLIKTEIKQIKVVGHTDNVPIARAWKDTYPDNYALSKARAETVAEYLRTSLGLADHEVQVDGKGEEEPVADNSTPEGRAQNRRTEIFIETHETTGNGVGTISRSISDKVSTDVVASKSIKPQAEEIVLPPTTKQTVEEFDEAWLENAQPGIEWLMPGSEFVPTIRAVNIAIKHHPKDRIEGFINGKPLNAIFFFGMKSNSSGTVGRSYWQGIHIEDGPNEFEFQVYPHSGGEPMLLERSVHFSSAPARAELVPEYSRLIADGRSTPVLAVRFYDHWNQPVRGGVSGEFAVQPPYQSKQLLEDMSEDKLAAFDRQVPKYEVAERGIAYIELEPTSQSGKVTLNFKFNNSTEKQINAWLKPVQRDWIVVGMGEGIVGKHDVSGDSASAADFGFQDDSYDDGRLALFAKGGVGEDWLLTTAIDSDKEESATGQGLFQTVDPDSYFALYGDNTDQRYEAPSSDKLFLKLENDRFYALYGDYDTGLNTTELSKYNRRITGLKSEFNSERFGLNFFAAETDSQFVRDEILGDGTSGLYQLRGSNILINSETIVIETRDRFHSHDILDQRSLRRHYDYNIDYLSGTILFKRPIPSRDQNFNPIYIVAEYETGTGITEELTAGGRGEIRLLDGDIKLGLSAISDQTFASESKLYGLDVEIRTGLNSRLRLEYADSETDNVGTLLEGEAYLAEYEVGSETTDGRIYIRQQDAEFGLGQQAGSESATRKYGIDGGINLSRNWRLNAEVSHEDNLATDAERDVAEVDIAYNTANNTLMAGLRTAKDVMGSGEENKSELLLAGASTRMFDGDLQLRANAEYALDSVNANSAYPTRYIVGAEYALTSAVSAYLEQEITDGERQDTSSTRLGIQAQPWSQTNIDTSIENEVSEYGPRTFALMGLTQGLRINEKWSADLSYDRAETIRKPGDDPFNTNVPPQSGAATEDFSAVSTGLTWRGEMSTAVTRLEYRDADLEDRYGWLFGWHRDLKEGISYGIDSQMFASEKSDGSENSDINVRLSFAYRPTSSRWAHLNRFDYKNYETTDSVGNTVQQRKLINNWKANYMPNRRNQWAISYGVKYVLDTYDETEYKGLTHSVGSEYRFDLTERWDVGAHVDMLYSENANNRLYSYGLSTGFNLVKNLWLSLGYNFDGYKDDDFVAAEYTAEGPYLKLRFKFDQNSFGFSQ